MYNIYDDDNIEMKMIQMFQFVTSTSSRNENCLLIRQLIGSYVYILFVCLLLCMKMNM